MRFVIDERSSAMASSVFQLVNVDTTQVVLKVVAEDNLTIAMHPYISGEYDYITVTRGEDHILIPVMAVCSVQPFTLKKRFASFFMSSTDCAVFDQ